MDRKEFFEMISKKRIPLSVQIEITRRCNWRCKFCYLGADRNAEMNIDRLKSLLFELKDMGCLRIVFTGGEPFIREDAMNIFRFAKKLGFLCDINTNGSLIQKDECKEIANMFSSINISLHSHDSNTFDNIVGVKGAFDTTISTIRELKKVGANITINSVITRSIANTYNELKQLVESDLKCSWNPDTRIRETYAGSETNAMKNRLTLDELNYKLTKENLVTLKKTDENAFCTGVCKAARNTCFIDAEGKVFPCLEFKRDSLSQLENIESVYEKSFYEIWQGNQFLMRVGTVQKEDFRKCIECDYYKKCFKCMANNFFATKNLTQPSEEICKTEKLYSVNQ